MKKQLYPSEQFPLLKGNQTIEDVVQYLRRIEASIPTHREDETMVINSDKLAVVWEGEPTKLEAYEVVVATLREKVATGLTPQETEDLLKELPKTSPIR